MIGETGAVFLFFLLEELLEKPIRFPELLIEKKASKKGFEKQYKLFDENQKIFFPGEGFTNLPAKGALTIKEISIVRLEDNNHCYGVKLIFSDIKKTTGLVLELPLIIAK